MNVLNPNEAACQLAQSLILIDAGRPLGAEIYPNNGPLLIS